MRVATLVSIAAVPLATLLTASGAQAAGLTCMPRPSACGFPDASTTGVPPGTPLTVVNGPVTLRTPGMTYSGHEVHGDLIVAANNVTIEKVRVVSSAWYPINLVANRVRGTVIRDVEIDMAGQEAGVALGFDNLVAQRVWIHNGLDCAYAGTNVIITDSFCDLPRLSSGSSAHADGFQSGGGSNYVFRHNTIRNPNSQTSAILMSTNTGAIDNVVIDDNLMSGGGYTVYCGTDDGGVATHARYTNNVISREFFPNGGGYGPTTWCNRVDTAFGNVWDGNYARSPASGARSRQRVLSLTTTRRYARRALAQEIRARDLRAKHMVHRCHRVSRARASCRVGWRSRPGRARLRRYSGTIAVQLASRSKVRYSLRVRRWSSATRHSVRFQRSGSLRA
jgi:hypothetical protein